jgi:hypothetical protein
MTKNQTSRVWPWIAGIAVALAGACGVTGAQGDAGQSCYPNGTCNSGLACKAGTCVTTGQTGDEGRPCYGNGTCNGDLVCQGGACVSTGTSTGTGATGGTGGTTGSGGKSTGGTGGTTGSSTATTSTTKANSPPVILSFGTNVASITQGEQVQLTAVVTDPDGIDENGATYGAFATTAQEGAYQFSLSWDQLNQVTTIDFAAGATPQRTVKAQFFDQAGHMAEKTATITLTCKGEAACAGVCVNLLTDTKNCGSCGHACGTCDNGKCASWSGCMAAGGTCASYCTGHGMTCSNQCLEIHYGVKAGVALYSNTTCTASSGGNNCSFNTTGYKGIQCCCAQ